jgi:hypothetical protein
MVPDSLATEFGNFRVTSREIWAKSGKSLVRHTYTIRLYAELLRNLSIGEEEKTFTVGLAFGLEREPTTRWRYPKNKIGAPFWLPMKLPP